MNHGLVETKKPLKVTATQTIPEGTKGILTAYLPEMDRFAVFFEECGTAIRWITFVDQKSFDEYCTVLELNECLK